MHHVSLRIVAPLFFALAVPAQGWARPVPAAADERPVLPSDAITASNSRELGAFGSEADALAAARAANLVPGVFGLATINGESVAISARGRIYARAMSFGSGMGQREPKRRKR